MPDPGGNSATAEPLTFEAAFAADASPASDTPSPSQESAPAAAQPETTTDPRQTTGESDDRSPFIPRSRFDEVNTSLKELKAERERLAWAANFQPQHVQTMARFFTEAQRDPRSHALQLLDELAQSSPEQAQAIRSELARRLGTRQAQAALAAATDDSPQPDVDITDGQGNVIGRTYSDKALAKVIEATRRQTLQEAEAKFAPQFKTLDTIRQEREQQAAQAQADTFGNSFASELSTLPLFNEHKAEIARALQGMSLDSDHPAEVKAAAYAVYHKIVGPKLMNGNGQAVLADFQRKAHASASVNPSAAASSTPKRVSSFHDPSLTW